MVSLKKIAFRLFFVAELGVFAFFYITGEHGLQSLLHIKQVLEGSKQELAQLQSEIATLESDIAAWQTNDYFKEKIAREELQFARADEEIYFIS